MKSRLSGIKALVLSTLLVCFFYNDLEAKDLSSQAETYFQAGQYGEAIDIWNQLLTSGEQSFQVYYNIGLAESARGQIPQAVLSFEKALRLKPYDVGIREALRRERTKIPDAVIAIKPFILLEWVGRFVSLLRPGMWGFIGLFSLVVASWCWFRSVKQESRSRSMHSLFVFSGVLGLVLTGIAFIAYDRIYHTDEAIIMESCALRQAPSEENTPIRVVHPGEKVSIVDEIGSWSKVRLLNLEDGWMQNQCLETISLKKHPGL